jgi:hypothetical protein
MDQLADALSKAQAEFTSVGRDREVEVASQRTGAKFKFKYAELNTFLDESRAALTKNGLAILQPVSADGPLVVITTLLTHKSGQWIAADLIMAAEANTPRAIGSTITYGRRYGLASLIGMAAAREDDDGEAASTPDPAMARAAQQEIVRRKLMDAGLPKEEADKMADGHGKKKTPFERDNEKRYGRSRMTEQEIEGRHPKTFQPYSFLRVMGDAKKLIGSADYYRILGVHGVEHANEVKDRNLADDIYEDMKPLIRMAHEKAGENLEKDLQDSIAMVQQSKDGR